MDNDEIGDDNLSLNDDDKNEDDLIREILAYMQRFPPPHSSLPARPSSSLYEDLVMTPTTDVTDDVFLFDDVNDDVGELKDCCHDYR